MLSRMAGQFPQTWSTLAQVAFSGFCEQSTQSCTQSPSAKEIVVNRSTMNNSFLPIMFFLIFGVIGQTMILARI